MLLFIYLHVFVCLEKSINNKSDNKASQFINVSNQKNNNKYFNRPRNKTCIALTIHIYALEYQTPK